MNIHTIHRRFFLIIFPMEIRKRSPLGMFVENMETLEFCIMASSGKICEIPTPKVHIIRCGLHDLRTLCTGAAFAVRTFGVDVACQIIFADFSQCPRTRETPWKMWDTKTPLLRFSEIRRRELNGVLAIGTLAEWWYVRVRREKFGLNENEIVSSENY